MAEELIWKKKSKDIKKSTTTQTETKKETIFDHEAFLASYGEFVTAIADEMQNILNYHQQLASKVAHLEDILFETAASVRVLQNSLDKKGVLSQSEVEEAWGKYIFHLNVERLDRYVFSEIKKIDPQAHGEDNGDVG